MSKEMEKAVEMFDRMISNGELNSDSFWITEYDNNEYEFRFTLCLDETEEEE